MIPLFKIPCESVFAINSQHRQQYLLCCIFYLFWPTLFLYIRESNIFPSSVYIVGITFMINLLCKVYLKSSRSLCFEAQLVATKSSYLGNWPPVCCWEQHFCPVSVFGSTAACPGQTGPHSPSTASSLWWYRRRRWGPGSAPRPFVSAPPSSVRFLHGLCVQSCESARCCSAQTEPPDPWSPTLGEAEYCHQPSQSQNNPD